MTRTTTRTTIALAAGLGVLAAGPAPAQTGAGGTAVPGVTTGGAGNTGVAPPTVTGGVRAGEAADLGPSAITRGDAANPSNTPVPGTTPGVNIGGTPTAGPPGTGGTAGGPSLGR